VEALECRREAAIGDPQKRVVVAAHQDVREDSQLEALACLAHPGEEILAVVCAEE
jgi:hypothetical protein